jgi:hypothetical protein
MVVFSHYTKQQQHDTHQRNRRMNTLDVRQRRHGGDHHDNTRRADDGKGESNKRTRNYMATCLFICVYTTSTTVVSKQTIKKRYCERICVGASFASFVNSWEAHGLRTSSTKLIICTPSGEKGSGSDKDIFSKCQRMYGLTIGFGTGCGCSNRFVCAICSFFRRKTT